MKILKTTSGICKHIYVFEYLLGNLSGWFHVSVFTGPVVWNSCHSSVKNLGDKSCFPLNHCQRLFPSSEVKGGSSLPHPIRTKSWDCTSVLITPQHRSPLSTPQSHAPQAGPPSCLDSCSLQPYWCCQRPPSKTKADPVTPLLERSPIGTHY